MKTARQLKKQLSDAAYRKKNAARIKARKAQHRVDNPELYREWYEKRDVNKRRASVVRSNAKARMLKRALHLLRAARRRARKYRLPYDLDPHLEHYQKIIDAGHCQETGIKFDMKASRGPFSPSLDRIKPKRGYVHGNVRVILWGLNAGFAYFGQDIYAQIAKAFIRRQSRK